MSDQNLDGDDVVDPREQMALLRHVVGPAPRVLPRTVQGPPAQREAVNPDATEDAARENIVERRDDENTGSRVESAANDVVNARECEPGAVTRSTTRFGGRPSAKTDFGRKVGNQRAIGLYLPRSVREALDERRRATGRSRGALLIDAFRHGYERLLAEYSVVRDDDPLFAPVHSARQVHDGSMVTFYVPEVQTQNIVRIAAQLGVSVSEAGTMALVLELQGPEALAHQG